VDQMGRNEDRVAGLADWEAPDLVGRDKDHPTLLRGQNN
jgi:hypothetical protein